MAKQTKDGAARIAAGEYPFPHSHSTHEEDESNCAGRTYLANRIRSIVRREVRKAIGIERMRCHTIVARAESKSEGEAMRQLAIMLEIRTPKPAKGRAGE